MGRLTTHVLDTAVGKPAENLKIALFRFENANSVKVSEYRTNADGRTDRPMLDENDFAPGEYELQFFAGDYFDTLNISLPSPKFLDVVVIRFGISDSDSHYHVPLLLSPFGYSTYRGS
ncbi:MAG: hydroxyisourate hydrolase [Methyloligellaceae bacterium]